jgi:hypothetical protein
LSQGLIHARFAVTNAPGPRQLFFTLVLFVSLCQFPSAAATSDHFLRQTMAEEHVGSNVQVDGKSFQPANFPVSDRVAERDKEMTGIKPLIDDWIVPLLVRLFIEEKIGSIDDM